MSEVVVGWTAAADTAIDAAPAWSAADVVGPFASRIGTAAGSDDDDALTSDDIECRCGVMWRWDE